MMEQILNAVMAYQDFSTGERAREVWAHLTPVLKCHYRPTLRMWNFEVLRISDLRNVASTDAAGADMILIATRGAGELPEEVKDWIDGWLAQKAEEPDDESVLGLLFDAPEDTVGDCAPAQVGYLQSVARNANMGFLIINLRSVVRENGFFRAVICRTIPKRMIVLPRKIPTTSSAPASRLHSRRLWTNQNKVLGGGHRRQRR